MMDDGKELTLDQSQGVGARSVTSPFPIALPTNDTLFCLGTKWWYLGVFSTVVLTCVLMVACLATPKWVYAHTQHITISGGLLECGDCGEPFEGLWYSEAAGLQACGDTGVMPYCDLFEDLHGAGAAFLLCDAVSMLLTVAWAVKLFLLFRGSPRLPGPYYLFHAVSLASLSAHCFALLIWSEVSQASFSAACDTDESLTVKPEVCIAAGPSLAIVIVVLQTGSCIVYAMLQTESSPTDTLPQVSIDAEGLNRGHKGQAASLGGQQ